MPARPRMAQIAPARVLDTRARERAVPSLCAEESLVATHAAVAASDAAPVQDQIALFKALGGGWRGATVADR